MGYNYHRYSARDNNCQDFLLNILLANKFGGNSVKTFIKCRTHLIIDIEALLNLPVNGSLLIDQDRLSGKLSISSEEKLRNPFSAGPIVVITKQRSFFPPSTEWYDAR